MTLDAQTRALLERVRAAPDDDTLLARARAHLLQTGQRDAFVELLHACASRTREPQRAAALFIEAATVLKESDAAVEPILAAYAEIERLPLDDRWRALSLHARAATLVDYDGDRTLAISLLEKALVYDPTLNHSIALLARLLESASDQRTRARAANLYARLGEKSGRTPYYKRALSIDPTCEQALALLEITYLAENKRHELVPYWERFVEALERGNGTSSARAEAHVRSQLESHDPLGSANEEEKEEDFPRTAPTAKPMHAPRGIEAESTNLRAKDSTSPRGRSKPSFGGWAPPDDSAPIAEEDPDDSVVLDRRAMQRLFPSAEARQRADAEDPNKGHAVELVHFRHDTALSVNIVQDRLVHPKISVLRTSKGAKVSFPRGYTNANHSRSGRSHLLAPGLTEVELGFGDRLDSLIGGSRFAVSIRPVPEMPTAPANIQWKGLGGAIAGSLFVHIALLLGFAGYVVLEPPTTRATTADGEPSAPSEGKPTVADARDAGAGHVRSLPTNLKVRGSFGRAKVLAVIRKATPALERCYQQALGQDKRLSGQLQLKWTVTRRGRVSSARVVRSSLANQQLETCALSAIRQMRFPKPSPRRAALVSHTFVFERAE